MGEACQWYGENAPKGEFVLVVEGAPEQAPEEATLEDGLARALALQAEGASLRDAVRQAAKELSLPRSALYDLALRSRE